MGQLVDRALCQLREVMDQADLGIEQDALAL